MVQTQRSVDMKAEREVNKFLNHYFYPFILPGYTSENTLIKQLAGIDTSVQNMYIDEKCQLENLNRDTVPTQCLELQHINKRGGFSLGWYLDPRKTTTHYLITWVVKCEVEDKKDLREENIICMKAILVSVEKIRQKLISMGFTDQYLHKEMLNVLVHHKVHEVKYNRVYVYLNHGMKITRTLYKAEKPINFIVPLYIYEQCCDGKYIITKEGVTNY